MKLKQPSAVGYRKHARVSHRALIREFRREAESYSHTQAVAERRLSEFEDVIGFVGLPGIDE